MSQYKILMVNCDTINEYYGMDTLKEQYVVQNVYFKHCQMLKVTFFIEDALFVEKQ